MSRFHGLVICAAGTLVVGAGSLAAGADVVYVDADTYLSNDSNRGPTANGGSDPLWSIRSYNVSGTTRARIGYLRFDISGVDPLQYQTGVLGGHFERSNYNGSGTWNVYGLKDSLGADNWGETTVTYANAPGVNNSAALGTYEIDPAEADLLGTITIVELDVQPLSWTSNPAQLDLLDFLNEDTDGLVTFIITDASVSGTEWRIDSKEETFTDGHAPPSLTFVPVPEPASAALLAIASGTTWIRRRKD